MIKTSYLRVYQPITDFPPDEAARWVDESEDDSGKTSRGWLVHASMPSQSAPGRDGVLVRSLNGEVFACPQRTRFRMLAGLLAFRQSVPAEVADAFVPEAQARQAAHELAAMTNNTPELRSHILHANWHVPIRWFVLFDGSERILTEDKDGLRIRYETTLELARERIDRAHLVIKAADIDESVIEAVEELIEWLSGFPTRGLLELDYASVAGMFNHEELLEDRSAETVEDCLEALAMGDGARVGRLFEALTERWTRARAHEVAN